MEPGIRQELGDEEIVFCRPCIGVLWSFFRDFSILSLGPGHGGCPVSNSARVLTRDRRGLNEAAGSARQEVWSPPWECMRDAWFIWVSEGGPSQKQVTLVEGQEQLVFANCSRAVSQSGQWHRVN
jgi:hypothetical protein